MGAKLAVLGRIAQLGAVLQELFVKGIAQLGTGSADKVGTAALAAVAVEGELADDQHFTAYICKAQIHFIIFVGEDPQTQGLLSQVLAFTLRILGANAQEDQKTTANLAVYLAVDHNGCGLHTG